MNDNKAPNITRRLGPWGWVTLVVLVGLLVASIVYATHVWGAVDTTISPMGWFFMFLGIVVTIAVGGGLMALVFYSSRHDYDR